MLETDLQKSVLHWKQGSSYIRDRLLQEQSTRRHKWKFPAIFLFRFSQVDQQPPPSRTCYSLQSAKVIRRTKQRAYKAPKELYSRCRLAQSSSSACQTPGRSIVEGTKEYVTKRTWKNVFHEQFTKNSLAWDLLVHTRRVEF